MASSNDETLLTYEKWVLGWHPEQKVNCVSGNNAQRINKFVFDIRDNEQIALIRPNQSSLYVLETSIVRRYSTLSFYKLTNDARPPIEYYSYSFGGAGVRMGDFSAIATTYQGDQFTLLIHSIADSNATVYLYPNSEASSAEVQKLLAEAREIRTTSEMKAKQDAEAKAKAEAEAKVAAEIKAKQEAEAKVAAELKAKQEAEAEKKKTTIICVKGKLTKKISALKPKCPAGYKKK